MRRTQEGIPHLGPKARRGARLCASATIAFVRDDTLGHTTRTESLNPGPARSGGFPRWGERAGRRAGDLSVRTRQLTSQALKEETRDPTPRCDAFVPVGVNRR